MHQFEKKPEEISTMHPEYVMPFEGFGKMPRYNREIVITEKIDGTNAQIAITAYGDILAGSRTRYLTPEKDNYGFAAWVADNKEELLRLGPGRHFGEWWGSGINRNYGMKKGERYFSLFNVGRWCQSGTEPQIVSAPHVDPPKYQCVAPACCRVVPVLYKGPRNESIIDSALRHLKLFGSHVAPKFSNPEGIVIFHTASGQLYKVLLENDEIPKSLAK